MYACGPCYTGMNAFALVNLMRLKRDLPYVYVLYVYIHTRIVYIHLITLYVCIRLIRFHLVRVYTPHTCGRRKRRKWGPTMTS